MNNRQNYDRREYHNEYPPHSRLFVVCDLNRIQVSKITETFSDFGNILSVNTPRDHNTEQLKNVAYIQFSKTSEAAQALDELNGKSVVPNTRPLKVMVATDRSDVQSDYNYDHYKRLFVYVPKTSKEDEIAEYFEQFGKVSYVDILRDHHTGDSKGMAFVAFNLFSEAAQAFEEADPKYKAIFAQPKNSHKKSESAFDANVNSIAESSFNMKNSILGMMTTRPEGYTRVQLMCSPMLTQYNIKMIFDIVPGMIDCQYAVDLLRGHGRGTVSYSNPVSAAYAVEKLNNFEYPPRQQIFVKPDYGRWGQSGPFNKNIPQMVNTLKNAINTASTSTSPDLVQLAEAIAEASKLIKLATTGGSKNDGIDSNDLNYCSVSLPPPKPLADIDSPVAKRCFLICKPQPPSQNVLKDVFCRFGDLISVYTLPNKTVGFACYASANAADEARRVLHGAEVCGVRMKVIEAEEEAPPKKRRME